jgi:hypothetical protein
MKYFGRRKTEVLRKNSCPSITFLFSQKATKEVNWEQTRAFEIRVRPPEKGQRLQIIKKISSHNQNDIFEYILLSSD